MIEKEIINRLIEARMEVTRIYANFPLELQKELELKADSLLQSEIGKLEDHNMKEGTKDALGGLNEQ